MVLKLFKNVSPHFYLSEDNFGWSTDALQTFLWHLSVLYEALEIAKKLRFQSIFEKWWFSWKNEQTMRDFILHQKWSKSDIDIIFFPVKAEIPYFLNSQINSTIRYAGRPHSNQTYWLYVRNWQLLGCVFKTQPQFWPCSTPRNLTTT